MRNLLKKLLKKNCLGGKSNIFNIIYFEDEKKIKNNFMNEHENY